MDAPFYIVGPTASGKSQLALALASAYQGEIVNADAFQLYRYLPITTAQPSSEDRAAVPHHLYAFLHPSLPFDVWQYQKKAQSCIRAICERKKMPLIVGGSGLYIKSLTHGLNDLPQQNFPLRQKLETLPLDQRIHWLKRIDPLGAQNINLKNPRHVTRALELTLLSGKPQSTMKTAWEKKKPSPLRGVFLCWERATLVERIHRRIDAMFATGWIQEISRLPPLSTTAEKAIGIQQIRAYLNQECSLEECITEIKTATRRYAKRQMTWFKKETLFTPISLSQEDTLSSALAKITPLLLPSHSLQ